MTFSLNKPQATKKSRTCLFKLSTHRIIAEFLFEPLLEVFANIICHLFGVFLQQPHPMRSMHYSIRGYVSKQRKKLKIQNFLTPAIPVISLAQLVAMATTANQPQLTHLLCSSRHMGRFKRSGSWRAFTAQVIRSRAKSARLRCSWMVLLWILRQLSFNVW